jgi:hypothetical protein
VDLEAFAAALHANGTSTSGSPAAGAARRLSDRTAALAAAASGLAPLLPTPATAHAAAAAAAGVARAPPPVPAAAAARFSGRHGPTGPGSLGGERPWQRGRMAELAGAIPVG